MALDSLLSLKIDGNVTGLLSALVKANQATASFANQASRSIKSLQGAFAGLGVTFSVGAFAASIKSAVNAMDELNKSAQKVGVSVEELSGLKYAAELSDVSFQELEKSLAKFNRTLTQGRQGSKEAAEALLKVGITAGDTTEQALLKVADAFSKMPDGARKTALAMQLFGKAGADLIPFLNQGKDGIEALTKEAERLGVIVSTETAQAAEKFNDTLTTLGAAAKGVGYSIANFLLEPLSNLVTSLKGAAVEGRKFGEVLQDWEFGVDAEGLQRQAEFWDLQRRGAEQMVARYKAIRDGQEETFGDRVQRGFNTVVEEISKWSAKAKEASDKTTEFRGRLLELAVAEDKVSGSGKKVADYLAGLTDVTDTAAQKAAALTAKFQALGEAIQDGLGTAKAGPQKAVEDSSVLDINSLREKAKQLLDRGDARAAYKAIEQAQKINDYLMENKRISTSYYETQANLLLGLTEEAQNVLDQNPAVADVTYEPAQPIQSYQQVWQEFLNQNPLAQPVQLIPQGATDQSGNPIQPAAAIPEGITPQLLPVPGLYAAGGPIGGPGTATSDSILARLSAGEYVVRAAAVKAYGLGFLERLNSMRLPKFGFGGLVPAFAVGGSVGTPVHLHLGGESIGPMQAGPDVAAALKRVMRTEVLKRGRR